MFNFLRFLLVGLVFFSGVALAQDYYWIVEGRPALGNHKSGVLACESYRQAYSVVTRISFISTSQTTGKCSYYYHNGNNEVGPYADIFVSRYGDSCPSNTEYNPETGECEEQNQCEAGQTSTFEFLYCYSYDGGDGCSAGTQTGQPSSFCRNSCSYIPDFNPSTTDADCYSYHNGDGTVGPAVYCSVTAETNGSECSGEYSPQTPDNSCPEGTVHGQVDGKNVCVPSGSGEGGDGGDGDGTGNGGNSGDGDGSGDGGDPGTGDGNGDTSGDGGNSGGSGSSGDGNGTGSGGTGDGEGDGEGGTGETVEGCTGDDCSFGEGRGDPFDGEVRSFSDSLTAAFSGIQASPLAQSITNIQFPTGGSCPTGSTSLDIGIGSIPIELTEHCNLWEQVAPILSAVFMALWSILAVRVFLSA